MAVVKSAKDVKTTPKASTPAKTVTPVASTVIAKATQATTAVKAGSSAKATTPVKTSTPVKTTTPIKVPTPVASTAIAKATQATTAVKAGSSAPKTSTTAKATTPVAVPVPKVATTVQTFRENAISNYQQAAKNTLINAKDDANRAQIAASVAKAQSANVNPETVKKIEQNVVTTQKNLQQATQQAKNVGLNPADISPYTFTPEGKPSAKPAQKPVAKPAPTMADFKQMEYAENQDNTIEMIDSEGNREPVDINDLLTTGTPEDWQLSGVSDEMGNPLYQDSYGRMITQADYYQLLRQAQNGIDMTGIAPPIGFGVDTTAGETGTTQPAGGLITPPKGGAGGAGTAGNAGQIIPNPSDSSNVSNMGDGTTSMTTEGGSSAPVATAYTPFQNPYFDKLSSMQFSYNEQEDPEYQNSVAAVENAVTQSMVARGGMYSSVYQSALSSKLIDLGIQFRKQRYQEYVDERNFVLTMAKTTFDMQMSMANYDLDIQKMNFDQNMTIAKFKLDQENSAFSRAMQMKEYNLKVSQLATEQNKVSAQSQLYTDQVNLSKDRQLYMNYMAIYDKYNAGASSVNVPPQLKAFLAANGIAVPTGKSIASTKAYIDNAMKLSFDSRTDSLSQRALALGDIESYSQSITQMSGMSAPTIAGYDRESSTSAQADAYLTRNANLYSNAEAPQALIDQYNKNPDAFKSTYGAYYTSQLLQDAQKLLD